MSERSVEIGVLVRPSSPRRAVARAVQLITALEINNTSLPLCSSCPCGCKNQRRCRWAIEQKAARLYRYMRGKWPPLRTSQWKCHLFRTSHQCSTWSPLQTFP
eukprot:3766942-Amphidinium_carterae.1